jgi:serine/threonine protein kinase
VIDQVPNASRHRSESGKVDARVKDSSTATERVGRYQLLEPIGGGPNGTVARAKVFGVAGFERQFAVKRFLPDLTQGAAAQALSQAARSYGSLEHPRIARMSEFGVAQGQTFTAVEYVAGLDVFRLLQEAKLASVAIAAGGALALISQAARAVGYAHGRGLSHLGLSPTNVIVTADGDVKVTDFGILAATMPPRPAESARLGSRVPYLAPEQVAGEATSAATDVFVLGVIAYELVTGQRAYRGESPAAIAQAILAGPPIEPTLPRPIVRVLQRCLARSPFERFPDARALADALDAALRVAPVPGTRKDVGAQVKTTLERYAQLNEGNVSGMVALNLQGQPILDDSSTQPLPRRPEARTEPSPVPTFHQPPSTLPAMPRASGLAGSTHKDMPKPTATVPGLAPPPIPVPPGVQPPPGATPKIPGAASTIPGMPGSKPQIPSLPKMTNATTQPGTGTPSRPTPPPGPPSRPTPPPVRPTPMPQVPAKVGSLTQGWDAILDPTEFPDPPTSKVDSGPPTIPDPIASVTDEPAFTLGDDGRMSTQDEPTQMGLQPPGTHRPTPGHSFDSTTGEMSRAQLEALNKKAQLATSELAPVTRRPDDVITKPVNVAQMPIAESARRDFDAEPSQEMQVIEQMIDQVVQDAASTMEVPRETPDASSTMPSLSPPPPERPASAPSISAPSLAAVSASRPEIVASTPATRPPAPPSNSKLPLVAGIVLAVGILGAGGYYAYTQFAAAKEPTEGSGSSVVAVGSNKPVVETGSSAQPTGGSAETGSAATGSAGSAETGRAGSAETGSAGSGSAETGSAGSAGSAETGSAGSASEGSGSAVATNTGSAGSAAGSNAVATNTGSASEPTNQTPPNATPSQKSDQLEVTTTPPGARVFLDGAELGKTPMKTPGSADRHTLAVLLPEHELYIAEVDGAGVYNVTLNAVNLPKSGPGIKIETCKAKNRYYIYVDGVASGQTCPTAKRIVTTMGKHVVEVYDIVTETRKKYDVNIVDDRLSVRVKIDE